MKKISNYKLAILASCSLSLISGNAAFADSDPKSKASKVISETSETASSDRTAEIERELRLVNYDIERQNKRMDDDSQKFGELSDKPEPKAGKLHVGADKLKTKIQISGKKLMNSIAGKSDADKMSESQTADTQSTESKSSEGKQQAQQSRQEWKAQNKAARKAQRQERRAHRIAQREADIERLSEKPAPDATALKKGLSKLGTKIAQGKVRRDFREAEEFMSKFNAQKEILEGYKAQGLTDREALLARHRLVSDMISVQRSVKFENLKKLDKTSDDEKQNLAKLRIEQELLEGILSYNHDLEDSEIVNAKDPVSSLEKVQAKLEGKKERAEERAIAAHQLKKDLNSSAAISPAQPRITGLTAPTYGAPVPAADMNLGCASGSCEAPTPGAGAVR